MYSRHQVPVNFQFKFADEIKTAIEVSSFFDYADDEYNIEMMYVSIVLVFDKNFDSKLKLKEYIEKYNDNYVIGDPHPLQHVIRHYFTEIEGQLMKFFYDTFKQYVRLEISMLTENSFIAGAVILKEQFDLLNQ